MKTLNFFFSGILLACLLTGCTHEEPSAWVGVTGKWHVVSYAQNGKRDGIGFSENYRGTTDDYYDFSTNLILYVSFRGTFDIFVYTIENNCRLIIDSRDLVETIDRFDIQSVTGSSMVLYKKNTTNAANYTETVITFEK
jgi:hypothetical protein